MNRASEDSDLDIDHAPVKKAYLKKRLRHRAKIDELKQTGVGLEYLIRHREIALYEKKKEEFKREEMNFRDRERDMKATDNELQHKIIKFQSFFDENK